MRFFFHFGTCGAGRSVESSAAFQLGCVKSIYSGNSSMSWLILAPRARVELCAFVSTFYDVSPEFRKSLGVI
eukprot:m.444961 g.444961  ORF g.444961 m.444961 type:complete len:72 (-) comp19170_c0_seq1:10-225(-)